MPSYYSGSEGDKRLGRGALREHLTAAAQHSFGREGVVCSHLGLPAMKTDRAGG